MPGTTQSTMTDFFSGSGIKRKPAIAIFDESSSSPSGSTKKRRISREVEGQRALDAGQANIGAQKCDKCEMVYSLDVEGDVIDHESFCNGSERRKALFIKRSTLDLWVKKVLSLAPGHSAYPLTGPCTIVLKVDQRCSIDNLKTKVEEIVKTEVNESLGYTEEGSMWYSKLSSTYTHPTPSSSQSTLPSPLPSSSSQSTILPPHRIHRKAYMAIVRDEKGTCSISGVLLAEAICRAIDVDGEKMIRADKLMGVNRLWVKEEMRGKGIAKSMVDSARESFYSMPIPRSRVVFSEPTKDGERFARSYVRNDDGRLLVYNLGDGEKWKEIMKKTIEMKRRTQSIIAGREDEEENSENIDEKVTRSSLSRLL